MAAQLVILLAGLAVMPWIVRLLAGGWPEETQALTTSLSRITFPYLILTVAAIQLSAMLNAIEKFWAAAAWSNFLNLAMIGALLASPFFPNAAYAAAWGVLAGGVAQLAFMLWAAHRHGLKLKFRRPRWTPEIAEFFRAFGAVTIGAGSVVIAPFIDTFIVAHWLPVGSRTALYYADRINQLPLGVLGIALGARCCWPDMAARLIGGDKAGSDAAQNRAAALVAAADAALRGGVCLHPRHHHARSLRSWCFRPPCRRSRRPGADGLWRGPARHGAGADRCQHILCAPRHRHGRPRHPDRLRLQHRHQAGAGAGSGLGHRRRRPGHGCRSLDQCRAAGDRGQVQRPAGHPGRFSPRVGADHSRGRGGPPSARRGRRRPGRSNGRWA